MAIFMLKHGRVVPVQQQQCSCIILWDDGLKQTSLGIWHVSLQQDSDSGRNSAHGVSGLAISLFSVPQSDTSDTQKENFKARKLFKKIEVLLVFMEQCFHHSCFTSVYLLPLYPMKKLSGHWYHLQVISGFRQYLPNEGHTESQNDRMVGVGIYLRGSFVSVSLPNQSHIKQVSQDCEQAALEYLQAQRLHNLPGQSVPVLSPSQHRGDVP